MPTLDAICKALTDLAPLHLAEPWDNVGLLVGDRDASIDQAMTCLTITPPVVDEAIERGVDLIIAHHPLPFKPVAKLTTDRTDAAMVLRLAAAGIAVYSAHTAFDSAAGGINDQWAGALQLTDVRPLHPSLANASLGSGRIGRLPSPTAASTLLQTAASICDSTAPRMTGPADRPITKVAIACGSGGSFVDAAAAAGADVLLTGESTLHQCLAAQSVGMTLAMVGHHASEHWAMTAIRTRLADDHPELTLVASRQDRDPVQRVGRVST